ARFAGDGRHVVRAAVAPAAPRVVLVGRVLRVLDEQVDAPHELDQAPITPVYEPAAQAVADRTIRLVIGHVGDCNAVRLDPIAHAHGRVVQVVGAYDRVLDANLAFLELGEVNVGPQIAQGYREIGEVHLACEHVAQGAVEIAGAVDHQVVAWQEYGGE